MFKLNDQVSKIPKIGPKYQKLLNKLQIHTIEDLIYHFPFRYNDFSNVKRLGELVVDDLVTTKGYLENIKNIYTRSKKRLTVAKFVDGADEIQAVWFNQQYLVKSLVKNKEYNLCGKVDTFSSKLSIISPDVEEVMQTNVNTGRLVPIYPETRGISSKWLRTRINAVLQSDTEFGEFLPPEYVDIPFNLAVKQIHFPDSSVYAKKAKKRFQFEELFLELLKVELSKSKWQKSLKGIKMSAFKKEVESFIQELPFPLTQDQNKAVEEIVHDMKQGTPMNRLLEGDVGTGKTIVAIIAAYLAYLNGEKTLYMAPTEILANQHFDTFKNFLNEKNIKITLKTGTTKKSTKESEKWDIVIGTHALLYDRDGYENVGLVIIDEQHRFGVEQRAKLLEYEKEQRTPHLLTMTATPIPRTLALTLYGDLSISVLKDPPNLEKKITTWVVNEKKREDAFEWVKKQKEQVFVVCPFIEESTSADLENVKSAKAEYEKLKAGVFSHVKVGLLHGRMKAKEKDEVLGRFRKKEIDVLVSTPVIEVGVDIPEANIMVIESAERYGLASLHQLRGRVGRGEREAFCLIFPSNFSKSSIRRLKYLEKLNSGLDLAEIDMKLRGHGEIYGTVQHGYKKFKIADVTNVNMLENAKRAAQETLPKLSEFSQLKDKLDNISLDALSKN